MCHFINYIEEFFFVDSELLQSRSIQFIYKCLYCFQEFLSCFLIGIGGVSNTDITAKGSKSVICSRKRKGKALLQKHGIGKSVCYMEQCSDRTAHSVDNGNGCIVECDSCFQSCYRHLYSCFFILSIMECYWEEFEDSLYS